MTKPKVPVSAIREKLHVAAERLTRETGFVHFFRFDIRNGWELFAHGRISWVDEPYKCHKADEFRLVHRSATGKALLSWIEWYEEEQRG